MLEQKSNQHHKHETEDLRAHKLTVARFASSRSAKESLVAEWKEEIEAIVKKICPLDFFPQEFVLVNAREMQTIAAREGFPRRYEHWRFGQNFENVSTHEEWGLSKLYELVINNDPCIAYLLDSNTVQETRLVMAHVYFHNIFFKHNGFFADTDREMLQRMGEHADRIGRYQRMYGPEAVERFLDTCLSLDNLIDAHSVGLRRARDVSEERSTSGFDVPDRPEPTRFEAPSYLDRYINPPEALRREVERELHEREQRSKTFPPEPEQDVMLFLMKHAPMEAWQQDIMSIVREEAYYFAPNIMTKIMNEGWASFWHSKMMTEHLLPLYPAETVDYCDLNARVLGQARSGVNPYRLGARLFRDIEERWNKGKFGPEWEACRDMAERENWDKRLGRGLEKVIEAMQTHNDLTFIDRYLTPEFCAENKLFVRYRDEDAEEDDEYDEYRDESYIDVDDFEQVRLNFRQSLTNRGQPKLAVVNGNHGNRGDLVIFHSFDFEELDRRYVADVCRNLHKVWTRPVHVLSQDREGSPLCFSFDGDHFVTLQDVGEWASYYGEENE